MKHHIASCDIEQILLSQFFTGWDFNKIDMGWCIAGTVFGSLSIFQKQKKTTQSTQERKKK